MLLERKGRLSRIVHYGFREDLIMDLKATALL